MIKKKSVNSVLYFGIVFILIGVLILFIDVWMLGILFIVIGLVFVIRWIFFLREGIKYFEEIQNYGKAKTEGEDYSQYAGIDLILNNH